MNNALTISDDKTRLNIPMIHAYLHSSYWAEGIPLETVARSVEHSLCFGAYLGDAQVGFARVVSDYATFMYLADVFVLEEHQGQGIATALLQAVFSHAQLQGLRTSLLLTKDAHKLYEAFGFEVFASDVVMRRNSPHPYPRKKRKKETA